ncbi:4-hydroxy-tetrahydrodipicolinate synthase [Saccharopolyspora antimicrobica]|uniref:4-hydroxy-tetrahydrodipicolinate synthase n=1 Tax=Saccharopolyspora antimicrobica TaxID=455193 RepID=A0A1I5HCG3_9PSEU|nr:dihydrodipicolinate synthase family protein [Saccharopolyspora antimicrobica]RKT85382.1 4-hydroxy-tetrahydrodipicolinate synthase [Saccharopolyspora antimicrobica]SFO45750.1 4-hydroxy-tetrahydrodipicolinate synthase [Saccharopolyspora antimicrobica]
MFTGLSAFPLTPTGEAGIDEQGFRKLVGRLAAAGVDSIGALGSTGGYAYLTREERSRAARIAVDAAGDVPVMVGIGALRTSDVLALAEDAQNAGASAVLLAPVSYQQLTDDEVFGLYEDVAAGLSVPLCVYDNPGTTHFRFSDELHARIASLPNVGAVKIPGIPEDQAPTRIAALRNALPEGVALGVSGDQFAAGGLNAGADVWFSVIGGLLPEECLAITRAARHDAARAVELSQRMTPLWKLFERYGSLRVTSAAAEHLGLIGSPNLPRPLRGLPAEARREVADVFEALEVRA